MRALAAIAPDAAGELTAAYQGWLEATGRGNSAYDYGVRWFFARWPDPAAWAAEPLAVRLAANSHVRPLLNFLMLHGHLQPGYDYLLERKLPALLREAAHTPMGEDLVRFGRAAAELGYAARPRTAMASQVAARLMIQTAAPLAGAAESDLAGLEAALDEREARHGRTFKHYRTAIYATRTVLYHLGCAVEPAVKRSVELAWSWQRHLEGVSATIAPSLVSYLECCVGTHAASTVKGIAARLAFFGRTLAEADPTLASLADLDRQAHIEPFLAAIAAARHPHTGLPLSASERRSRILTVGRMLEDITEWGWTQAPSRRLIFARDVPRLPRALPRYLPPDADRRLTAALEASPDRLRADALLLARATGLRIGELRDLELDCVHEVAGQGAWLKVPLGKLDTERMVPLDDETLDIVDRIAANRSPGRPLPQPRTGRLVEFLLTHQGRRVSVDVLRDELARAADTAGLERVTPHQLRHTYATALGGRGVASGASLRGVCDRRWAAV